MNLIENFHKMETESVLFSLGEEKKLPIWDIIRYHVFLKYYYPEKDRTNLKIPIKHSISEYLGIIKHFFIFFYNIVFQKSQNLIFTYSRDIDSQGLYFDKSAMPILKVLGDNYLLIEAIVGKKMAYKYIYDFSRIFRKVYPKKKVPISFYTKINKILIDYLGENLISYDEINYIYTIYKSQYFFYKLILSIKRPKNLIICTGNPKALILVAKECNVNTFLVQHGGIEIDEIDYSYPSNISPKSPILFPDIVLTFGSYWGRNINIPAKKIIPIGNDFFYSKPQVVCDNSILIVSTIIHGGELKKLTKKMAEEKPDLKFIFKLHPNEFHFKNKYIGYFKNNENVTIITTEEKTNILISRSQLVVLIVSAVLYEALNQNKKVVIYKKINFERQLIFSKSPNVYFIDSSSEVFEILSKRNEIIDVNFYEKSDYLLIKKILNNCN